MSALSKQQIAHLTDVLAARHNMLVAEVRAMLEQSGNETYVDIAGRVTDTGDESVADMLADMGAAQIHRHVQELRDIEAARARLRANNAYGVCIDCGGDIVYQRLSARIPLPSGASTARASARRAMHKRGDPRCEARGGNRWSCGWPGRKTP
jgi:RNA polymerase-binding transcription factor DksA